MPTYVYECESNTEHRYEKMQKFSDPSDTVCPVCGGVVHRVITGGVGLIFNGKGFYQTDYKGGNPATNGTSKKNDESKTETKTETKSDTATTDTKPSHSCGSGCTCH